MKIIHEFCRLILNSIKVYKNSTRLSTSVDVLVIKHYCVWQSCLFVCKVSVVLISGKALNRFFDVKFLKYLIEDHEVMWIWFNKAPNSSETVLQWTCPKHLSQKLFDHTLFVKSKFKLIRFLQGVAWRSLITSTLRPVEKAMSTVEERTAYLENPFFEKHVYGDFTTFYITIAICTVFGVFLFALNLICGCCSQHRGYWNDRFTGLSIWWRVLMHFMWSNLFSWLR